MVVDKIKNASLYYGLGKRFKLALRYLEKTDFSEIEPGRYEIDGENVYAFLQTYVTSTVEKTQTEGHERYADIHLIVSGQENVGYAHIDDAVPTGERIPEADMMFYRPLDRFFYMKKEMFGIFWPEDIHQPRCVVQTTEEVVKVLVKVKLD